MKTYAVIGLGNFGMTAAAELVHLGARVAAMDHDPGLARDAQAFVDRALVGSATDPRQLDLLGVGEAAGALVSLGDAAHATTLVTLHLQRRGVREIVAKALDEDHAEILSRVGASRVVYPEKEMALRVARRLSSGSVLDFFSLAEGFGVLELAAPGEFVGRQLSELDLAGRYGLQVLAVKELVPERILLVPRPDVTLKDSDIVLMAGTEADLMRWGATRRRQQKFVVVGMGSFGLHLVRALYGMGHDVMAVDKDAAALDAVGTACSRAEVVDASDHQGLAAAGVADADVAVVSLGSRIDVSILAAMHLKRLGVREILAKAVTPDHALILKQMGATGVIQPEQDVARRAVARLIRPDIIEEIPFLEGYSFTEIPAPEFLHGRTLAQADLRRRFQVTVVAVNRRKDASSHTLPAAADLVIEPEDVLLLLARPESLLALDGE